MKGPYSTLTDRVLVRQGLDVHRALALFKITRKSPSAYLGVSENSGYLIWGSL